MKGKYDSSISYEDILLHPIDESHLELLRSWRNKDNIRKWFVYQEKITEEGQIRWFDNYQKNNKDIMFIIQWNGSLVGCAALYEIDVEGKKGEFGRIMIGEEVAQGKGLGVKITHALCYVGFHQLGLEEIYLSVFKDNHIAIKVYEKVGFVPQRSASSQLVKMTLAPMDRS